MSKIVDFNRPRASTEAHSFSWAGATRRRGWYFRGPDIGDAPLGIESGDLLPPVLVRHQGTIRNVAEGWGERGTSFARRKVVIRHIGYRVGEIVAESSAGSTSSLRVAAFLGATGYLGQDARSDCEDALVDFARLEWNDATAAYGELCHWCRDYDAARDWYELLLERNFPPVFSLLVALYSDPDWSSFDIGRAIDIAEKGRAAGSLGCANWLRERSVSESHWLQRIFTRLRDTPLAVTTGFKDDGSLYQI